jgi:predicted RecA/RadA family phage recombinase
MKNYVQPGDTVTVLAPTGGVSSGDFVVVGKLFGVAAYDAAAGAEVEIATRGVYVLPKAAVAVSQGAAIYWDGTALTTAADNGGTPPVANLFVGHAVNNAAEAAATVRVRLSI